MLKKFFHWLSGTTFTSAVFFFIITATAVILLRPGHIKIWVSDGGIYKSLPSTLIKEVEKKQDSGGEGDINFKDKGVQDAATKALTPEFLQTSTEQFIDGTFNWVDGKTDKPDFKIDVLPAKQRFASGIVDYSKQRYAGLPACAKNQLPKSTDPLTINCRPAIGIDIDQISQIYNVQLLNNKDFLPDPQITADTISKPNSTTSSESPFNKPEIPKAYKLLKLLPIVLGVLAVTSAIGFIFTDKSKKEGLGKIGRRLIIIGFITFALILISSFGLGKLRDKFSSMNDVESTAYAFKEVILSMINSLQVDIIKTSGLIAGGLLASGLVIVLVLKFSDRKSGPKAGNDDKLREVSISSRTPPQAETKPEVKPAEVPKPTQPRVKPPLIQ